MEACGRSVDEDRTVDSRVSRVVCINVLERAMREGHACNELSLAGAMMVDEKQATVPKRRGHGDQTIHPLRLSASLSMPPPQLGRSMALEQRG